MQKECGIVSIILVQGFCPLKIKITQFPNGFLLNSHGASDINSLPSVKTRLLGMSETTSTAT